MYICMFFDRLAVYVTMIISAVVCPNAFDTLIVYFITFY